MERGYERKCCEDPRRNVCVASRRVHFAALFLALLAGCEQQTTATVRSFDRDRPISAAALSVDGRGRRVLSVFRPERGKVDRLNSYAIEQTDAFTGEYLSTRRVPGYGARPAAQIELFRSAAATETEGFLRLSFVPWSDAASGLDGSGRAYLTRSSRPGIIVAAGSDPESYRRPVISPLLDARGTMSWVVVAGADFAWGSEGQRVQLDSNSIHLLHLGRSLDVAHSAVCKESAGLDELICLRDTDSDSACNYRLVVVAFEWVTFGSIEVDENVGRMQFDKRHHLRAPLRVNRLVDQDDDGVDDVAVATRFGSEVLSGRTGDEISACSVGQPVYAIGDINEDGRQDWIGEERVSATRSTLVLGTQGVEKRAELAIVESCFTCLDLGVHYSDDSPVPTLLYPMEATVILIDQVQLLAAATELTKQ